MNRAAITLVMLGLPASPQPGAAFEFSSFSGKAVESRDWSQLCVEKDGDYFTGNADGDNPFVGCARTSAAANTCQRQCARETSDCISVAGRAGNRPDACFNYTAACMSRCKGE
jgi:hypothetical protein